MEWTTTPELYGSPGFSPPNRPLPPTPDDGLFNCNEIAISSYSPTAWQFESSTVATHIEHNGIPMPWLAKGELQTLNPEIHPGLQYMSAASRPRPASVLGKRPVSGSPKYGPQQALKSSRTCPEDKAQPATEDEEEEEEDIVYGEPHMEIGIGDQGKHYCSCGKGYVRASAVRQHIEREAGNARHPCLVCGKIFSRQDIMRRHEDMAHKGKKIPCPGCNKTFRPDFLQSHLNSSRNAKCKVVAHAMYIQSNGDADADTQPQAEKYWIPTVVATLKRGPASEGLRSPKGSNQSKTQTSGTNGGSLLRGLPSQFLRAGRSTQWPCDICGLPFGSNEQELIDHLEKHAFDFDNKAYPCDECQISFAFQGDLDLHLESANKGHCGINFSHLASNNFQCTSGCTGNGHHPPKDSHFELVYGNHRRMETTLWAWENCQLRAHQATIARLLAERLHHSVTTRHSANDELSCMAILTRLSIGSIHSFHSVPAWVEYADRDDVDELDITLNGLDLVTDAGKNNATHEDLPARARARPESTVLGLRNDVVDFTMEWKDGKLTPTPLRLKHPTPSNNKNTYMEQLQSMRSPGGLKTRASGVRFRAKAATRSFFAGEPDHQGVPQRRHALAVQ